MLQIGSMELLNLLSLALVFNMPLRRSQAKILTLGGRLSFHNLFKLLAKSVSPGMEIHIDLLLAEGPQINSSLV